MDIKDWIKRHEGFNSHPYFDSVGKLTIGWGRNIEDNGISKEEADALFENDFDAAVNDLMRFDWWVMQPKSVQDALINMRFNLGLHRLLGFTKMIQALQEKNYSKAAQEALDSRWAKQVGDRAKDVALMIREADASTTRTDTSD
ncbi:MAG TPA: glycoside hydrolase family protein [Rummeliibacillus sp.]|nr:glycoside hydrolase family protein [Rummeliibacillus sp.]